MKVISYLLLIFVGLIIFSYAISGILQYVEAENSSKANEHRNEVLTGDGPPPKKLGKIGDVYLDTHNSKLDYYVKIAKKQWEFRGSVTEGAQGPQGEAGPLGEGCTIESNSDGSATITCGNTSAIIPKGTQGEQGPPGVPCEGCVDTNSIADNSVTLSKLGPDVLGIISVYKVFKTDISNQITAECESGDILIGGGGSVTSGRLLASLPSSTSEAWVSISNQVTSITAVAICADLTP